MDQLLETIDLDVDSDNELLFKVHVEGAEQAKSTVRLVCESEDCSYMFTGRLTGVQDVVQFNLPSMKNKLKEGNYTSRVEVLVDNRYFAPVEFNINFKTVVSVVAEAVSIPMMKKATPVVSVTAAPIQVKKPVPVVEAAKPTAKPVSKPSPKTASLRDRYTAKLRESVAGDESDEDIIREIVEELAKNR